jgi:hypothetical protein
VAPQANSLVVSFTASVGGYPTAVAGNYYYSKDGTTYQLANPSLVGPNTFTISSLFTATNYQITMYVSGPAGNQYSINTPTAMPYVLGTQPTLLSYTSGANSVSVSFNAVIGGNPTMIAGNYYYSTNGTTYVKANPTLGSPNTFVINPLYTNSTINMYVEGPAGNLSATNTLPVVPYVVGSTIPNITSVAPGIGTLVISYTGPVDAFPNPHYYYSLNSQPYANTTINATSGTITVPATTLGSNVKIMAVNPAGNVQSALSIGLNPYIVGSKPDIISVASLANALSVAFNLSTGGYDAPAYYYSVSGNASPSSYVLVPSANITAGSPNTFVIYGLSVNAEANVSLLATNSAGNVYSTTTVLQTPYVLGTAPNITSVVPGANSLVVSFNATVGGYPLMVSGNYYYSKDGTTYLPANPTLVGPNTFTISSLFTATNYTIRLYSSSPAGDLYSINTPTEKPYVLGTTAPNITSITSAANSLVVRFTGATDANPDPYYYYSVSGGAFVNTTYTSNSTDIVIPGLTTKGIYDIQLMSVNPAGNVVSSIVGGSPYVLGTAGPNITRIQSAVNSLIVSFTGSVDANPEPYYYYSVDGGAFVNTTYTSNSTDIVIPNLTTAGTYSIQLMAVNPAGNVVSANVGGSPYVTGSGAPVITAVQSQANSLVVSFTGLLDAYPAPYYYYSVAGGAYSNTGSTLNANITINDLTVAGNYAIQVMAVSSAGNVVSANAYGQPYVVGNAIPIITSVSSAVNSLVIEYSGSVGAYPEPYYYYSVAGGAFVNTGFTTNANIVVPGLTTSGNYAVSVMAVNPAGNLVSVNAYGYPYVIGTAPNINSVASLANAISVSFQASTGGYPAPTYYYTIDSGSTYALADVSGTSFVINGLFTPTVYSVGLLASNPAGNILSLNTASGEPYVLGTVPVITEIKSNVNSLDVAFAGSRGAYPAPEYYYSVNGAPYVDSGVNSNAGGIIIPGLTAKGVYTISILANNPAGNLISDTASGEPYVVGGATHLTEVQSRANSLAVYFDAPGDWNPTPFYYYTVDGTNYANSGLRSNAQPIIISGLYSASYSEVRLRSLNVAGPVDSDNSLFGIPYVLGTVSEITRVDSSYNAVVLRFTESQGGYPNSQYYYSVDGGQYVDSGQTSNYSGIAITGLTVAKEYVFSLMAVNPAGNLVSGNATGRPYVIGTKPTINAINIGVDSLSIDFNASTAGYPEPYYYYSTDGITYANSNLNSNATALLITGLDEPIIYTIYLIAVSVAGNTEASTGQGEPYSVGTALVIYDVSSSLNQLAVYFTDSSGGNPSPSAYYYSIDGGATYVNAGAISSPFTIGNLTVAGSYPISMYAVNTAGNTEVSNTVSGQPYVIGTKPNITTITPGLNTLTVYYEGSVSGYPAPTAYYYSSDGGNTYTVTLSNPIVIPNLFVAKVYGVCLFANNLGGNTELSSIVNGEPYVIGNAPNISSVESGINRLSVYFTGSLSGYPAPTTYLYSLDGGNTYVDATSNVSPIVIANLYNPAPYTVELVAVNTAGNSAASNAVSGTPYVIGNAMTINSVSSGVNSLTIGFEGPIGGYPEPTAYYYSVDGGSYVLANVSANSFTIDGLTEVRNYVVRVKAQNLAGNTAPSLSAQGVPFVAGTPVVVNSVISGINRVSIYYTTSATIYPAPTAYYYSLDGGNTYTDANSTESPIVVGNLYSAVSYPITVIAKNAAGNTAPSNVVYGGPFVAGSSPNILSVSSGVNSLSVAFLASVGGYPTPYYYYSVDGGATYVNSGLQSNASPMIIDNLTASSVYQVSILARNDWGDVVGSSSSGRPYVVGSAGPEIIDASSIYNGLVVSFSYSVGAYPEPQYYYSVDSGNSYTLGGNASPITISGLTVARDYPVKIMAVNVAGNVESASRVGNPYVIGTTPNILSVSSGINRLSVAFQESTGAYPAPTYYCYVDGNAFSNSHSPIVVAGLTVAKVYNVDLRGISVAGNTGTSSSSGQPYVIGSSPVITSVASNVNSLTVGFQGPTGGYPAPTAYYYSLDYGNTYINANITASPLTITDLNVAKVYEFQLIAENLAGNTSPSATASGEPYIIGQPPTITSVSSIPYGLEVGFTGTTDGYPAPTTYYYSVDGGNVYLDSGTTSSPMVIRDLSENRTYSVKILAHNLIGNTLASASFNGTPYILGNVPVVSSVVSIYNGLVVNFSASEGGNPAPTSYFYSLDGGNTFLDSGSASSPITLSNLTVATNYSVAVYANNLAGRTATSNAIQATPYVIGQAPNIGSISSIYNGLSVAFSGSTGGYPEPTSYYYSLDGGITFVDSGANASPVLITGLTTATVYSVVLLANGIAGQSAPSNVLTGEPYVIGGAPTNVVVSSVLNGLTIQFTGSVGGYPAPSSYFYSLDGGNSFVDSGANGSPISVAGLNTATEYNVVVYANSVAGRSANSAGVLATPYIIGSAPVINSVVSGYNQITINYTGTVGGNPAPTTHYYSLDGGASYIDATTTATPIVVSGLTSAATLSVRLKAKNVAGNTSASNQVSGRPYVIGGAPNINSVSSVLNGISVAFSGSTDGYPDPSTYYYSLDGGVSFSDSASNTSPILISGLSSLVPYDVVLRGANPTWPDYTAISNTVRGQPYIIGTVPEIYDVSSIMNGLVVLFNESVDGFPSTPIYYYSVDGGNTYANSGVSSSPLVIANLNVARSYSVRLFASSVAGNTAVSADGSGTPYILGTPPTISNVVSLPYSVSIDFSPSTNGFPDATTYYYSLNGGNTFVDARRTTSPIVVSDLSTNQIYSVVLKAGGLSGITAVSNAVSGRPYVAGSAPNISSVASIYNGLSIAFTESVGGYPEPTTYYYSLNNGATYNNWGNTATPIVVRNLTSAVQYTVKILAVNLAGNSAASNALQQTPLVIGGAPTISRVASVVNGLSIVFTGSANGYPAPSTYYYSLDGGNTFVDAGTTVSPISVGNLTTPTAYSVVIYASGQAGNTANSNAVIGVPYVIGTAPTITSVDSSTNRIIINFVGSSGGTEGLNTYYFYSLNGGNTFANSGLTSSPIVVSGLNTPVSYSVVIYSVNSAGQSPNSETVVGRPYVIGSAPTIQSILGIPGGLAVNYTAPTGGYPDTTTYYYSVNSGAYVNAESVANPLLITGLVYTGLYRVQIFASSLAGNTQSSLQATGRPYILGSIPVITNIVPDLNKLTVSFTASTGGYPVPTSYFYSTDGIEYVDSGLTTSPIVISGLTEAVIEQVTIKANSLAGMTAASNIYEAEPYVFGSTPVITRVVPGIGSLYVYFNNSTGGNPDPTTYLYSLDGIQYVDSGVSSNAAPVVISGLTSPVSYSVRLVAQSVLGLTPASNVVYGIPYIRGTTPVITDVSAVPELSGALAVFYTETSGGYPTQTTYYYSVNGGLTFADARSVANPLIITGLTLIPDPYLVVIKAHHAGWQSEISNMLPGTPYIAGTPPTISNVVARNNGLSIYFADSSGGYPYTDSYYYTLNGGNTYSLASGLASPIQVDNLTVAINYPVGLVAHNLGGNTAISNVVFGKPYVIGQPPVIANVVSGSNSLSVYFSPPLGGNPQPTAYYYSVDGGNSYVATSGLTSPQTIVGLTDSRPYTVQLIAENVVGNTALSAGVSGEPYTAGANIMITGVSSVFNGLSVAFATPTGWYPPLSTYYYSLDGISYVLADTSSSPIVISGLTTATQRYVSLKATNSLGAIAYSNTVLQTPYVVGSAPVIQHVYNVLKGISVSFIGSTGGYPAPSTYLYSVDGGATYLDSGTNRTPVVIDMSGRESYVVSLKAVNNAGTSAASNSYSGNVYVVGNSPTITSVESILNGLVVHFSVPNVSYATPVSYLYSLDGVNYVDTGCVGSPLTIGNLTVAGSYTISLKGVLTMSNVSAPYVL